MKLSCVSPDRRAKFSPGLQNSTQSLLQPRLAVCDDAAAELLAQAWPTTELVRVAAPTAADALNLCAPRFAAGDFVDLALLDGHYLRRSDAEIFGETAAVQSS